MHPWPSGRYQRSRLCSFITHWRHPLRPSHLVRSKQTDRYPGVFLNNSISSQMNDWEDAWVEGHLNGMSCHSYIVHFNAVGTVGGRSLRSKMQAYMDRLTWAKIRCSPSLLRHTYTHTHALLFFIKRPVVLVEVDVTVKWEMVVTKQCKSECGKASDCLAGFCGYYQYGS